MGIGPEGRVSEFSEEELDDELELELLDDGLGGSEALEVCES